MLVARQLHKALVLKLWMRLTMITGYVRNDLDLFIRETEQLRVANDIVRVLVML